MYNNNFNSYQQGQFPSLSNGMYQVPQPGVGVGGYPMQPPTNLMQQQSSIGMGGYPMQTGFQQPLPNSAFQTGTYLVNQQLGQQGGYNTQIGSGYGNPPVMPQQPNVYNTNPISYQQQPYGMQPGYQPMNPLSSNPSTQPLIQPQMNMGGLPNTNIQTGGSGGYGAMGSYNCENDCAMLKKAMKGLGTDEDLIINILAYRTSQQRVEIKNKYKALYGKDLIKELKSELSGSFEDAIIGLMYSQVEYDARLLYKAMHRLGTDEGVLIEIIATRSPQQLTEIKQVFQREYKKDLIKYVESETSGHFKKVLVAILQCQRHDNNFPVDQNICNVEAQQLYAGGQGRWGTDEGIFTKIFASRSNMELCTIANYYQQMSGRNILDAIESEFSGDVKKLFKAIFHQAINTADYFATRLKEACSLGAPNRDKMIRIIISRSEVDLTQIKQCYFNRYKINLIDDVRKCAFDKYLSKLFLAILNRP